MDSTQRISGARLGLLLCLVLATLTLSAFWGVGRFEFIAMDDAMYVLENRNVRSGLTAEGLNWAFKLKESEYSSYWQPLTWISHMLDVELYGANPGAHHLTNLLIHLANALLLFFLLYRTTGAPWKSFFVAALFALHPLNVESVAWVSGRKNVLSTFFWLLTLLAYAGYAERPTISGYVQVLVCYALGLMTKPMLVTLPFVLLLLDHWPLGRLMRDPQAQRVEPPGRPVHRSRRYRSLQGLALEKLPLFALSAGIATLSITLLADYRTTIPLESIPFGARLDNALISYVQYLIRMFWPLQLAVYYPFPRTIPGWQTAAACGVLVAVSWLAVRNAKKRPYFLIGWLWYLGTLVPVIGLVQAGLWPGTADRWVYVPLIGCFIVAVWGAADLFGRRRTTNIGLLGIAVAVLFALTLMTRVQAQKWRNSEILFRHAVTVNEKNAVMHTNLANVLLAKGDLKGALRHYQRSIELKPDFWEAHHNLGTACLRQQENLSAIRHFKEAIRLHPGYAAAYKNLGTAMARLGRIQEAEAYYRKSLSLAGDDAETHHYLGLAFLRQGKISQAIEQLTIAIRLQPDDAAIARNLLRTRTLDEKLKSALAALSDSLQLTPDPISADETIRRIDDLRQSLDAVAEFCRTALMPQPGFDPKEFVLENDNRVAEIIRKYGRVLPLYRKAAGMDRENPERYYLWACIYALTGRRDDALRWVNAAVQRGGADSGPEAITACLEKSEDLRYKSETLNGRR